MESSPGLGLMTKPFPLALAVFAILGYYCMVFRSHLRKIRAFSKEWPGLPHHPIWGHLISLGEIVKGDRHFDYACLEIWNKLDRPPFFLLDSWPLTKPNVIVIADAELAESISKATLQHPYSLPKSPTYADLHNLFGEGSIVRVHGEEWRQLKKKYGPGFNSKYLQGLLPEIIQQVKVYMSKLDASAGKVITVGDFTTPLTIDIICAVVLGHPTGAQTHPTPLTIGFQGCIDWQLEQEKINPFHIWNPLRPLAMLYYEGMLNRAVDSHIADAFTKRDQLNSRSIIALTIEDDKTTKPSADVVKKARDQIKSFLLAGHDTTSTFLQYLYYELSIHPKILSKIRAEHKAIFGSEKDGYHARVEEMFQKTPEQVMQGMTYTTAVMKETLRFHPIAGGSKCAPKGTNLTAQYGGKSFCLDEHTLHFANAIHHMDEKYWGPDANIFNPDRFLEGAKWIVPPFAFRPFERGPRACIAQEFVYLEAKVILAFTVNTFEFEKVYDTKYKELYSIRKITAKPNDGMRMCIKRAE